MFPIFMPHVVDMLDGCYRGARGLRTLNPLVEEDAMNIRTTGRGGAHAIVFASLIAAGVERISIASAQVAPAAPTTKDGAALSAFGWPLDKFHDLETKYIFGFTDGADIGLEGEKAIDLETTTEAGIRTGTYGTIEQELEFEGVPSQYWGYELS